MDTHIYNPSEIFAPIARYTIPPFQRRYVWTKGDQWEPLWDDVINLAETYLERFTQSGGDRLEAQQNTLPHFLGAVVFQHIPVPITEIGRREVIDGQQRMTTLQLLLDAIQYVFEDLKIEGAAQRLSMFVTNTGPQVADEHDVFKLWPTTGDREAFRHAMHNGLATDEFEDSLIVQAHEYFQLQAREWLNSAPESMDIRAQALETAVTGLLQIVVIDLNQDDDPYVIFETLNARGTPLLESDLIKNYVMSEFRDSEARQAEIWGRLDDSWWSEEVTQGRLRRPRKDMLFDYWLEMSTTSEVAANRVYRVFRSHTDGLSIDRVMSDVRRDLENYRRFEEGPRTSDEEMFHYRAGVLQAGAITPVLLLLLSAPLEERIKSLKVLESFLVRRMLCRGNARDYNRLTLALVGELQKHGLDDAGSVVASFLKSQRAESRNWPDDRAVGDSLGTLQIYRVFPQYRIRMILEAIEMKLRQDDSMVEQTDVPKNLTIEHVMPRSWGRHWPLPNDLDTEAREDRRNNRNRLIHTMGNLSLTTRSLGSSLSNGPWESKRKALENHGVLYLNKTLLNESEGKEWNEEFIQARSKRMAKLVAEVWPGPDSPVWDR